MGPMADVIAKLVDSAKKILLILTVGRLALLFCLIVICLGTIGYWENRTKIYSSITSGDKFSAELIPALSDITKTNIKNIVDRNTNIIAVQILRTDFRTNTRDTMHFYSDISDLQREFDIYLQDKVSSPPLFASNDTVQNERLIKIIEQEFVCVSTPDNIAYIVPQNVKQVQQICSISVPPRYGRMIGYINLWLNHPMDPKNLPYYKAIARTISDEVYDRDVLQGRK